MNPAMRVVQDMVSLVTPPLQKRRRLVVLKVYADESGTHDLRGVEPGSEVAAVVGYVANEKQWQTFSRHWRTRLDEKGIGTFHMSDINSKHPPPPYDKWPWPKTEKYLTRLAKIASKNTWFSVGGMLVVKDYNEIVPDWLRDTKKPYFFCFELFFARLLHKLPTDFPKAEKLAFIFDKQTEYDGEARKAYDQIKATQDFDNRLGAFGFGPKEEFLPLQAADLVVYHLRRYLTHSIYKPKKERAKIELELERRHNLIVGFYDRENLKVYIDRLIVGQVELTRALSMNALSVRLRPDHSADAFSETLDGASRLFPILADKRPDLAAKCANLFCNLFEHGMKIGCVNPDIAGAMLADQTHVQIGLEFEGRHPDLMRAFRTQDLEKVIRHLSSSVPLI